MSRTARDPSSSSCERITGPGRSNCCYCSHREFACGLRSAQERGDHRRGAAFPRAATEISRKKRRRCDAEELGELEDLSLGERAGTARTAETVNCDPDLLRQLNLAEPVRPHQFAKYISLGDIRHRNCSSS